MPLFSNLPAARLALAYLIHDPPALLPHATVPTLLHLPIPLGAALPTSPTIKALVVDKDNTLCPPKSTFLHAKIVEKIRELRRSEEFQNSDKSILIVSNTAGSTRSEEHEAEALELEQELGLPVLRQHPDRRKPLCKAEILDFFARHGVTKDPAEIAVVGDRLATDVLLARDLGSWSVWVRDGWRDPEQLDIDYAGLLARWERTFEHVMRTRFYKQAPLPR